jgi:hypothetical protein
MRSVNDPARDVRVLVKVIAGADAVITVGDREWDMSV